MEDYLDCAFTNALKASVSLAIVDASDRRNFADTSESNLERTVLISPREAPIERITVDSADSWSDDASTNFIGAPPVKSALFLLSARDFSLVFSNCDVGRSAARNALVSPF